MIITLSVTSISVKYGTTVVKAKLARKLITATIAQKTDHLTEVTSRTATIQICFYGPFPSF